jgi:hypothetical protein
VYDSLLLSPWRVSGFRYVDARYTASMPSNVRTLDDCRWRDGFPLYFVIEGGGCLLLTGLARVGFVLASMVSGLFDKCSPETGRTRGKLVGLATPIAESEILLPILGVSNVSCSLCSCPCTCFSTSSPGALLGKKSQIDDALDSLRIDGSGVLPLETHTPSTSTPLSSALIPNGTSSARGTPGPRRFWLISRCRACSLRSFSATAEYSCSRQWVWTSWMLPRHIVRAMPPPRI